MKRTVLIAVLFGVIVSGILSCGRKNKNKEVFLPALSFINSQIAQVDTSLYQIVRLNFIDSNHVDTEFVKREDFARMAVEFTTLPDISSGKLQDAYQEERLYDEQTRKVFFIYTPVHPEEQVLQREELMITPNTTGDNSQINSIFITTIIDNKDSMVEKKLLWQTDRSFQVNTRRQLPGKPEETSFYKVMWNAFE